MLNFSGIGVFLAAFVHGAKRVDVEDLIEQVKARYADDFAQRIEDGDPPALKEILDLGKSEELDEQETVKAKKAEKTKFQQVFKEVPVFDTVVVAAKDKKTGIAIIL